MPQGQKGKCIDNVQGAEELCIDDTLVQRPPPIEKQTGFNNHDPGGLGVLCGGVDENTGKGLTARGVHTCTVCPYFRVLVLRRY